MLSRITEEEIELQANFHPRISKNTKECLFFVRFNEIRKNFQSAYDIFVSLIRKKCVILYKCAPLNFKNKSLLSSLLLTLQVP